MDDNKNYFRDENFHHPKKRANSVFYIVLALSLIAIGAAVVILALSGNRNRRQAEDQRPYMQTGASDDETLQGVVGARATAEPTPLPTLRPKFPPLPTEQPQPEGAAAPTTVPAATKAPARAASTSSKANAPVSGSVTREWTLDKLIYSKTLDAWVTHNGVDLAAMLGSDVKCVFAGTIERVYQDDALGYTVVVQHTNNRTTQYANLAADIPVREGDKVNAGTVLGKIGASALSECADESHLHFVLYMNGKSVDPAEYVRIGSK
ncbi:MAG: M23 family metallopeptidase [Clostridiales bacterium]|nr:M23 family metallopeptidase [Clostridiales bacterium]